jgi:hypothetical protein
MAIPAQSGWTVRRRGGLRGLWGDLSDRTAAGDPRALLSKYGVGMAPGCMGIPFLGVGVLVMVLVGRKAPAQGHGALMPIAVGAVFALAGLFLVTTGVSAVLSRAAQSVAAGDAARPWESDYPWDQRCAPIEGSAGGVASVLGRLVAIGFIALFNVLWTVPMAASTRLWVGAIVVLVDLVALAIIVATLLSIWQRIVHGRPSLLWKRFPTRVGERLEATFSPGRSIHQTGPAEVELTCVEQGDAGGGRIVCYGLSTIRQSILPPMDGRRVKTLEISLDVPAGLPGTRLSASPAEVRFWRLTVKAPVLGPDVSAAFLVPIYAARGS